MCGYFGNLHECPAVIDLFNQLKIPLPYPTGQHYTLRTCDGLITASDTGYRVSQAMWWYAMHWDNGQLVPNQKITSFNARNLDGRMWRKPMNERRGIVIATEIGETQGKPHYLMRAKATPLAIGALYQDYQTDDDDSRSFALITRTASPSFAHYHEKAMPLFLPWDEERLMHWLDPAIPSSDSLIQSLIDNPSITTDLEVTRVKTFKRAEPLGDPEILAAGAD